LVHTLPLAANVRLRVIIAVNYGWRRSVVFSALASINAVNRHWAQLVGLLGWVIVCGRVNHLGMQQVT